MSRSVRALVKPEILVWARESAGMSVEEAAKKLGTSDVRITTWEQDGNDEGPTVKQLQKMAKVYRRPLSVFYLQERPYAFQVLRDYRRQAGTQLWNYSSALILEQRFISQRREQAFELAEELDIQPKPFHLKANLSEDPEQVGARIRNAVCVSFAEQIGWSEKRVAFNAWRQKVEELDILVFQMSRVPSDELSGFAISHEIYLVIAINRNQAAFSRRSFTLTLTVYG